MVLPRPLPQPGTEVYESFFEILRDIPLEVVTLSIIIAVSPFIMYYWKTPYLRLFFKTMVRAGLNIQRYSEKKKLKEMIKMEYERITGKKIRLNDILSYGVPAGTAIFAILILKKAIFLGLVVSQSMLPTLMEADLVLIESLTTESISSGDIVLIAPPGQGSLIIHRVISVEDGKIRTKGDNTDTVDPWVLTKEDVKGKAVRINGKPVTIKNLGIYFMPVRSYVPGSDPAFELVKKTVETVHTHGPIILIGLLLLTVIGSFGGKRR